jgi:hypothetical protein
LVSINIDSTEPRRGVSSWRNLRRSGATRCDFGWQVRREGPAEILRGRSRIEIQLTLRLSVSQTIISDFIKQRNKKSGLRRLQS